MPIPTALPTEHYGNVKLAISIDGALRAAKHSKVCEQALIGRLRLEKDHYVRVGSDAIAEFVCDLRQAAIVCDLVQSHDRSVGDEVTAVYTDSGRGWKKVSTGALLNTDGSLNRHVFDVQVEAVHASSIEETDYETDLFQGSESREPDVSTEEAVRHESGGSKGEPKSQALQVSDLPEVAPDKQSLNSFDRDDAPEQDDITVETTTRATEQADGTWYNPINSLSVANPNFVTVLDAPRPIVRERKPKPIVQLPLPIARTFAEHHARWKDCQLCPLGRQRSQVVLCRGKLPCDVLFVGEGPGTCLSGDTLIEVAFRDLEAYPDGVPIRELVGKEFQVYSFSTKLGKLAIGNAKNVRKTGERMTYRVTYFWWGAPKDGKGGREKYSNSIVVTANHPFLLKTSGIRVRAGQDRYMHIGYKSIDQGLSVGDSIQPFYRYNNGTYDVVGVHHTTTRLEHVLLAEKKFGLEITDHLLAQVHHKNRKKKDNSYDNLDLLSVEEHARIHSIENNVMHNPIHREAWRHATQTDEYRDGISQKMKSILAPGTLGHAKRVAEIETYKHKIVETLKKNYEDPTYYLNYLRNRRNRGGRKWTEEEIRKKFLSKFPNHAFVFDSNDDLFSEVDNHEICAIEPHMVVDVFDMEVESHNNFAAHGVFVHNSEDALGVPFVGPAGILLDEIGRAAFTNFKALRRAFTNLVACFPREAKEVKINEPDGEEIQACAERLREIVSLARPRLVVCVGGLSEKWFPRSAPGYDGPTIHIEHPAWILRIPGMSRQLAAQRCVVQIITALKRLA